MLHEIVIRNGTVVDGTGAAPFVADVAIDGGKISAIGKVDGKGTREIDAAGAIVTPGFVDIHTHYDGQISWDADLMPSSQHGVTTVVMGNCGVGFAPCRAADRDALIALMEGVEDIPGSALAEGIKWEWETFAEYMDALSKTPRTIDFGMHVPHDALRVFVMRERAIAGEVATDDDITKMRDELRRSLEAGALGFTTGRSDNHRSRSGDATPAAEANTRELVGIAQAFDGLSYGVLQAVSDFNMAQGPDQFDAEFDVLERMAEAAPGHRISFSLMQRDQEAGQWKRILTRVENAAAHGIAARVQVAPRGIGVLLGFEATFHPFMGFPSYKAISHLPLAERVAKMREPEFRARLLSEKSERVAGDGSALPPVADWVLSQLHVLSFRMFRLGENPSYEPLPTASLGAEAKAKGIAPLEAILDALLENEGRELLYFPVYNYTGMNLDTVHEMLTHPLALPGLSDGGAHVGTVCDASFPTFLLTHWVRDRAKDRIALERAVQMLSNDTAVHMGLRDRGRIAVGLRADINVIDMDRLRLRRPRLVADLPAGGKRLLQDAEGYRATLVFGTVIAENGLLTGARPGRLVRAQA
jgi:N-acyl-D-aspartate/D-glutamate deacylase